MSYKIQIKVNHIPLWFLDWYCNHYNLNLECEDGQAFLNLVEVV
ncbi:MAG: hypothetical protein ACTSQG_09130 [Promethearchaeota archaeon]